MSAVALTGGIASGKSTVAGLLRAHAVSLLDSDMVAAEISGPNGEAIPALRDAFGTESLTPEGGLDRLRMRSMVFSDAGARARLESILHPLIRARVEAFLRDHAGQRCVVAIPLFYEALTYRDRFARVAAVDCATAIQRARLVRDRQMAPELADAILRAQAGRAIRLQLADRVLVNNADIDNLAAQVSTWMQEWP